MSTINENKRRPNYPLSKLHISKLLEHCYDIRETLIITLALDTGMRVSDLTRLNWTQFDKEDKSIEYISKKTHTPVRIPLANKTVELLTRWKKLNKEERILPVTETRVRQILKDLKVRAGIKRKVTPHDFCVTTISKLLEKGVPSKAVADLTGRDVRTIEKYYSKFSPEQLRKWKEEAQLID